MSIIQNYFSNLTEIQQQQFAQLDSVYREWNEKINVISRKDIDNLYVHHVLHSLALAKIMELKPNSKILDVGTGGGFPGVPLAILYPEANFHLVDSIGKKLKVVEEVAVALGLTNIKTTHARVETIREQYDFIVTRAVAPLVELVEWVRGRVHTRHKNSLPNGIWAWKGTNTLEEELNQFPKNSVYTEVYELKKYFSEEFFDTKALVYVQL